MAVPKNQVATLLGSICLCFAWSALFFRSAQSQTIQVFGAGWRNPTSIAVDSFENIYIADSGNNRIVKLNSAGSPMAVFTSSSPSLNHPICIAIDSSGNIYISDFNNNHIVKLNSTGSQLAVFTTSNPSLNAQTGIAVDRKSDLYISDGNNNRIVKLNSTGGQLAVFTTSNPSLNRPFGIALDSSDNLYIVDQGNNRVVKLNSAGIQLAEFHASFAKPYSVTLDLSGNLYISDNTNRRIVKMNSVGTVIATFPVSSYCLGLALDSSHNLYVGMSTIDRIVKLNAAGSEVQFAQNPFPNNPTAVALDSSGNLYIVDRDNNRVMKLDPAGSLLAVLTASSLALNQPTDIAVDSLHNLYISDNYNNRIVKLNSIGREVAVFTTSSPSLNFPTGLALDSSDNLYIADHSNDRIVKLSPLGTQLVVFKTSGPSLRQPIGIIVDRSGNLYITDTGNNRIVKLSSTGTQLDVLTTSSPSLNNPMGITLGSSGTLFITDSGNNRIVKLSSTGFQLAVFSFSSPSLNNPRCLALDPSGNLYIADMSNNRVVKLIVDPCRVDMYAVSHGWPPFRSPNLKDFSFNCPANCSLVDVPVWGSGPYSENSSICLAAIHRGVITNEGGTGRMVVFTTIANGTVQDLFPAGSAKASLQFDVQSHAINLSLLSFNSNSFLPVSRGLQVVGVRDTPFLDREGMIFFANYYMGGKRRVDAGKAIYYNDIWAVTYVGSAEVQWSYVDTAPWSRRAYMATSNYPLLAEEGRWSSIWIFYGGETDEVCGQPICRDDVWLGVYYRAGPRGLQWERLDGVSAYRQKLQLNLLPHTPRCFTVLLPFTGNSSTHTGDLIIKMALIGGQLSADHTLNYTCQQKNSSAIHSHCCACSGSVQTTNVEEYRTVLIDTTNSSVNASVDSGWVNANGQIETTFSPFSPRRGMSVRYYTHESAALLVGGMQIIANQTQANRQLVTASDNGCFAADTATLLIAGAEFYSEIYVAQFFTLSQPMTMEDWLPLNWCGKSKQPCTDSNSAVMGSIPLPQAHATLIFVTEDLILLSGGLLPKHAEDDWIQLQGDPFNDETMHLHQPYVLTTIMIQDSMNPASWKLPSLGDLAAFRYSLPMKYFVNGSNWQRMWALDKVVLAQTASQSISWTGKSVISSFTPPPLNVAFSGPSFPDHLTLPYPLQYCLFDSMAEVNYNQDQDNNDDYHCNAYQTSFYHQVDLYPRVGHIGLFMNVDAIGWISGFQSNSNMQGGDVTSTRSLLIFQDGVLSERYSSVCAKPTDPSYLRLLGQGISDCNEEGISYNISSLCRWQCMKGSYIEPGPPGREVWLRCTLDSNWVDEAFGGVTRCRAGRINCTHPLVDDDDERCILPLPVVSQVIGSSYDLVRQDGCCNSDHNRTSGCSADFGAVLTVFGDYFSQPLQVFVGAEECVDPTMITQDETVVCTNTTSDYSADNLCSNSINCYRYTSALKCTLQPGVGIALSLIVWSSTRTSRPFRSAVGYTAPVLSRLCAVGCARADDVSITSCNMDFGSFHSQLIHCRYDSLLIVTMLGSNFGADIQTPTVFIGNTPCIVDATNYTRDMADNSVIAISCIVDAFQLYGIHIPVTVSQPLGISSSSATNLSPQITLSFTSCPSGSYFNGNSTGGFSCAPCAPGSAYRLPAETNGAETDGVILVSGCPSCLPGTYTDAFGQAVCYDCPAGTIANFNSSLLYNATSCSACPPGSYSEAVSVQCIPCAIGSASSESNRTSTCELCSPQFFSNSTGMSLCYPCPVNSWQSATGQAKCNYCTDNCYLVTSSDGTISDYPCHPCPTTPLGSTANCSFDGVILAVPGTWLYIDQDSGTVNAYDCLRPSACSNVYDNNSISSNKSVIILLSKIQVFSHCGPGRIEAINNVLCASCIPGYSEWNGVCVDCQSANVGLIMLSLFLLFLVVYALHRLPRADSSITAILIYYLQMSALFFSGESIFSFLHLFNFDLMSSLPFTACVMPLTPYELLLIKLFMPIAVLPCLLLLYGLELIVLNCNTLQNNRLFAILFPVRSVSRLSCRPNPKLPNAATYIRTIIYLALFSYTIITSSTLTFFSCRKVGATFVLSSMPAIVCYNDDYYAVVALFLSTLGIVVIGFPVGLVIFILYYRQTINRILNAKKSTLSLQIVNHEARIDTDNDNPFSENKSPTEPISLSSFSNPLLGQSQTQLELFAKPLLSKQSLDSFGDTTLSSADALFLQRYGILFSRYRPVARLHQPYMLMVRTILLAVSALVLSPGMRATWWTSFNILWSTIHSALQPYRTSTENLCELTSLAAHTLQTAVLATSPLPITNVAESIGFLVLIIVPLFVILIMFFYRGRRK